MLASTSTSTSKPAISRSQTTQAHRLPAMTTTIPTPLKALLHMGTPRPTAPQPKPNTTDHHTTRPTPNCSFHITGLLVTRHPLHAISNRIILNPLPPPKVITPTPHLRHRGSHQKMPLNKCRSVIHARPIQHLARSTLSLPSPIIEVAQQEPNTAAKAMPKVTTSARQIRQRISTHSLPRGTHQEWMMGKFVAWRIGGRFMEGSWKIGICDTYEASIYQ
jgi:hypothetical protein